MGKNEADAFIVTSLTMLVIGIGVLTYFAGGFDAYLTAMKISLGTLAYVGGGYVLYRCILRWMERR